jgi:outer membrane scaffolding protein for murein synthesis (MipA/OmpV family)
VTASLNVQAELHPIPAMTLSFGPEVIWGSEQYGMTFFGINATQSEIAGIAPYRVRAGFNTVGDREMPGTC